MFWRKRFRKESLREKHNHSNIGSILVGMNAITETQLQQVLAQQTALTQQALENLLLGKLLIDGGFIDQDQLNEAIGKQQRLRSKNKFQQSMAIADHAIKRHRRGSIVVKRDTVMRKGKEAVKRITSKEHKVITPDMLKGK